MTEPLTKWEELLDPTMTQEKLISASLYIAAFEILKDSICGRIKTFYSIGFDESGSITDTKYATEVLSRHSRPLQASLAWLTEHEAIDAADTQTFARINAVRNHLAHNLQTVIFGESPSEHIALFQDLIALLRKIETWWVVNVEIPTNPDYDGQEIDESGIVPGPVLMLQMMFEVASGNRELLARYRKMRGSEL